MAEVWGGGGYKKCLQISLFEPTAILALSVSCSFLIATGICQVLFFPTYVIRCHAVVCDVCRIPTVSQFIILTAAPFSVLISYMFYNSDARPSLYVHRFFVFHGSVTSGYPASST
jgi:hypothetical protein